MLAFLGLKIILDGGTLRGRLFCGKNFLTEFLKFLMCMLTLFLLLKLKLRKPVVLQTFLPCFLLAQRNPTKSNIGQFGYITEGHIIAKVVDISVQKIPQKHMPKERKIGFQRGGDCLTLFSQYKGIKLLGCVHFNHYPLCQVSFLIAQFVHIHRLVLMTWTEKLLIL